MELFQAAKLMHKKVKTIRGFKNFERTFIYYAQTQESQELQKARTSIIPNKFVSIRHKKSPGGTTCSHSQYRSFL